MFEKIVDPDFAVPAFAIALLAVAMTRRNVLGIQRITG